VFSGLIKLMRLASVAICVIVVLSFGIFAVEQTSGASRRQQEEIVHGGPPAASQHTSTHESGVHKAIDEAATQLTSPFAGVVSGTDSEWVIRGVKLLIALAVYGFGLSFLARMLLVRA
jgi:hypothetical protein